MKAQKDYGVGERIAEVIRAAGSNPHRAAIDLGVAQTTVNAWIKGTSTPDTRNLINIANRYNSSVEYLATGEGQRSSVATSEQSAEEAKRVGAAVDKYLQSDFGRDVSDRVAKMLRSISFSQLGMEDPTVSDVHRVRDMLEFSLRSRVSLKNGDAK